MTGVHLRHGDASDARNDKAAGRGALGGLANRLREGRKSRCSLNDGA